MDKRPTHSDRNPRRQLSVLVTDAATLGAIAAIRSLGRVGYRVIACSADPEALGLRSRHATVRLVNPPYANGQAFRDWLDTTLAQLRPALIVPSEACLLALRPQLARYAHLLPGADDPARLYRAFSKHDVLQSFATAADPALREQLPPTLLDDGSRPLDELCAAAVADLGLPLYLKVDAVHGRAGAPGRVLRIGREADLRPTLARLRAGYARLTLQGHAPGVGVAAFALLDRGTLRAAFMHRRLHEVPRSGGVSSYRCSWQHPEIMADALRRLRHLGHQGAAMVEYRWDPASDCFWFVEVNARFWGSLHLAIAAGVDFPRLLADQQLGLDGPRELPAWRPLRMRQTAPLEVGHLLDSLRDPALGRARKLAACGEFVALGLDPRVRSDLSFAGDRRLWWIALYRHARLLASRAVQRRQAGGQPCAQNA